MTAQRTKGALRLLCSSLATLVTAAQAAPAEAAVFGGCGEPATRISAIQGAGRSSPLLGAKDIVVEAVVVGAFPGVGGFFVQEEDAHRDADPSTSEGLFVFDGGLGAALAEGQRVRLRGRVSEFFGLTELAALRDLLVCPRDASTGLASAIDIELPLDDAADWERWEGMRVRIEQTLVATEHRNVGRFGEVELAAGGRLWASTHRAAPGAGALEHGEHNDRRRILLDDGSDGVDPRPTPYLERADGGTLRLGDRLHGVEGVLDFAFGRFRIHPTGDAPGSPRFEQSAPRPEMPPEPGGTLRFVAWNLGNHFNGDGRGGGFPTRGARSALELERQRAKLVATLVRLDPDVAALVEFENDGAGPYSAVGQLVEALDRETLGAPYAVIDPGSALAGRHAIAVAIVYRPQALMPLGAPAVLDLRAHPDFDDSRNRRSLAQSFEALATGERFTVVANHFKSKGSSCDAAGDPDLGDGQADCNQTRTRAARALVEWLGGDPTGAGDAPVLIAGDLNAYPQEDPVREIRSGGYVDLVERFAGPDAHSFVFDGEAGRLDYALAREDLVAFVAGADVWHVNADEPRVLDYSTGNPAERYAADPFRASDHDPVLVGLFPDRDGDGRTDARDACPHTSSGTTLRLGRCDSGVPEQLDAEGCSLGDRLREIRMQRPRGRQRARVTARWLAARVDEGVLDQEERRAILGCLASTARTRRQRARVALDEPVRASSRSQ